MVAQLQQYTIGFIVLGIGMVVQGAKRADITWLLGGILLLLVGSALLFYQYWHSLGLLIVHTLLTAKGEPYDEHRSPI
jgi:hypothetical protein